MLVAGVLALLIYFDFRSRPKALRGFRLVAIVVGLASLLALYLNLHVEKQAPEIKVAIESSGSSVATIDSLRQSNYTIAQNMEAYHRIHESSIITDLVVVGNGLERWELTEVKQPFNFLPESLTKDGPFELALDEGVVKSSMEIQLRMIVADSMRVDLSGPGIEFASKKVGRGDDQVSFSVVPTIAGYLKYQLDGVRGDDTLFSEVIPVRILERSKTSVLILSSAPSFENRFLKNYLAEEGFGVAERIQISTDVFRDSFTNLKRRSLRSITSSTLDDFQLVVLDASSYKNLGRRERSNLKEKLGSGELGLIWGSNETPNDLIKTKRVAEGKVELVSGPNMTELNTNSQRLLERKASVSFQNQEVGELLEVGLGKVVLPRVVSSYSLILKGEEDLYAQLWQRLLQPAIGSNWNFNQTVTSHFPRLGEPMHLEMSNLEEDEVIAIDSIQLAKQERWYQPGNWDFTHWPKSRGWNKISGSSEKFFVFDSVDWPMQKIMRKRTQTSRATGLIEVESDRKKVIEQPISKWIFFISFVVSFGFLWLEQRIR